MISKHTFRNVFVVAVTCLFCIAPLQGLSLEKTTAPKTPVPVPAPMKPMSVSKTPTPGPMQAELAAAIEKISLKGNRVVVLLAGKGKIAPEDYQKIILRVETSKGPRQWSLSEADKARSLIAGTGRVEFDTGILLDKTEMVKGVLLFGRIEKPRQEMLVIASTPMAPAARLQAAAPERPRTSPPSPVPRLVDRGIRILNPTVDNHYYQGETIYVLYQVSRAEVPTGNITFRMESIGMGAEVGAVTIPAARNGLVALTPRADTPIARYVITGEEPGSDAFGQSDIFYVDRNSARIDFIAPTRGQEIPRDGTLSARYQFNNRVEPGTITFQLGHAGTIVSTQTARHLPHSAGSTSPPIHTVHFPLASDAPLGEYAIIATHPRASGISPVFNVIRRTVGDGGGEETVYRDCDYGLESVTFADGSNLDTGISVGTEGSTIRGQFRVRIRWNGIRIPSAPPGTVFRYEIQVYSTATGERINVFTGGTFDYTTQETFSEYMWFAINKDDIPRMSRDRFIPLEFRLVKVGSSIDANPFNNTRSAEMRIINATQNNMEIDLNPGDFRLTRRPHAAPTDEYALTQRFRVRNLSRNDAGGPPSPVNLTVRGCVFRRDAGRSWETALSYDCSTMTINNVGSDWISRDCALNWRMASPWEIPDDTRFRVVLEVDHQHILIDPDRNNNIDQYTFRITEDPPGAGSGTAR